MLFNDIRGDSGGFPRERGSILDVVRAFFAQNFIFASAAYDHEEHLSAWKKIMEAAEEHNDPGKFTTFNAYEWTVRNQEPENASYHRNVIFKSSKAPKRPFSSPVTCRNMIDLFGLLFSFTAIWKASAISSIATFPDPSSSAPLYI